MLRLCAGASRVAPVKDGDESYQYSELFGENRGLNATDRHTYAMRVVQDVCVYRTPFERDVGRVPCRDPVSDGIVSHGVLQAVEVESVLRKADDGRSTRGEGVLHDGDMLASMRVTPTRSSLSVNNDRNQRGNERIESPELDKPDGGVTSAA